jgi:hypothetical protein
MNVANELVNRGHEVEINYLPFRKVQPKLSLESPCKESYFHTISASELHSLLLFSACRDEAKKTFDKSVVVTKVEKMFEEVAANA